MLSTNEPKTGVMCSVLVSLVKETLGHTGESPVKGYEDNGGHLSSEKRLRELGLFSIGKSQGESH